MSPAEEKGMLLYAEKSGIGGNTGIPSDDDAMVAKSKKL